jgi:DNA-directed RNA polymerase beta' subunit/intein/homing endonuclease
MEMNLFASQNVQTMSELMDLAAVPYMIVASRDGKPIIEVVQDSMLGSFRLTKDWTRIHDKTMANLQMVNSYFSGQLPAPGDKDMGYFTGKQAYSEILPPHLFIEMKNKAGDKFQIYNSEVIGKGCIDKTVFHALSRGLINVIFHDYSPFEVRRLLDNTQRLICRWLTTAGFSVGISDLVTDKNTNIKLKETISEYKGKAYLKVQEVLKGNMENKSIFSNEDFFEREILNVLNELTSKVGKIGLEYIDERTNRMINMVKSGSKGKETNVAQIIACVGQQNVDGKRVAYGYTDRTLPHFTKYDDGPDARGFVENSFISGLSPQEVFFHAMGGREGLIDTAVKSVTGDTQIFIIENGKPRTVEIGTWIDSYLDDKNNKQYIEYTGTANQELLYIDKELNKKVYIPTCDDRGIVTWGELTAVTRHDPSEKLYKVKTTGGREVTVADSESLLIWESKTRRFKKMHSKLVQPGMFVPVTMELPEPPVIVTEIDMSEYFPKNEYIYGTEFHKADRLMKEAMQGRIKIPRGWWEKNNGKTFTLPYPDKAKLQRAVSGRCNLENLKEGYIYPYHATRQHSLMPEKFELNYENGQFIGLFLADGNAEIKSGQVHITKDNPEVKSFVKKWFEKFSMKHAERVDERERGKITTVTGYSTYMAMFMHKLVGHTCEGKYVPDIAYIAPEEFVRGIISGYFSGDGSVPNNDKGITASSVSRNLIEGINLLLARLGIFAKISKFQQKKNNLGTENILPSNILSIRAQWARLFRDKIDLIPDYKNENLKSIDGEYEHCNYPYQNDVVLDTIDKIYMISPQNNQKLYDVTVPSTLNFQTRMGWHCRDTSETGYIQRRLVKAMEDNKIYYDQTVRNATGAIVQYMYGEDGIDGTKIENQYIPYISMNYIEIDNAYNIRPEDPLDLHITGLAMEEMRKDPSWIDKAKKYFENIIEDRMYLIRNIFKGDETNKIQYPIPFDRIIGNAIKRMNIVNRKSDVKKEINAVVPTDLTPGYVYNKIDELIRKLKIMHDNQGMKFLHILLRSNLSPKTLIFEHHMPLSVFEYVVSQIERSFVQSIAHPGEMVGIVAAQSIGELSTQQTLDSFHSSGTAAAVKATSGVPRLKELLSVSKNIKTPTLVIYMKPDISIVTNPVENEDGRIIDTRVQESKVRSMKIMKQIEITCLADILDNTEIYWDPPGNGIETGLEEDKQILELYHVFSTVECQRNRSQSPWVLRMKLNKVKMYRIGITMLDIYTRINTMYNQSIDCVFSDDNASELIFRIRLTKEALKDIDLDDAIAALKAMEYNLTHNVLLKGVKGIKKVSMRDKSRKQYNYEEDRFEKINEWILDTDGTNLVEILANPNIDAQRTRSNDIYEIYQVLGIEAARSALYYEFMEVVGEGAINYRHMSLLLDTMTNRGTLMSIDRHGINRGDVGPLAKCSFEETTDMLINASIFSELDNINGVSANIMLGQLPPCGTGDHEILIDEKMYMELLKESSKKKEKLDTITPALTAPTLYDEKPSCAIDNIAFKFKMPTVTKKQKKKLPDANVTFV